MEGRALVMLRTDCLKGTGASNSTTGGGGGGGIHVEKLWWRPAGRWETWETVGVQRICAARHSSAWPVHPVNTAHQPVSEVIDIEVTLH